MLGEDGEHRKIAASKDALHACADPNQICKTSDSLDGKQSPSRWLRASNYNLDRFLVRGSIANLCSKGTPMADVLPERLVVSLLTGDKVLALRDQVKVEGVLF